MERISLMVDFLPQRKKQKINRWLLVVAVVIVAMFAYYSWTINAVGSDNPETQSFVVTSGEGATAIADRLEAEGLIRSSLWFKFYVWQQGIGAQLQDGEYFLSRNLTIQQIAEILSRGAGITKERTLTFIEGWHNDQIADYLVDQGFIDNQQEFFAVVEKKADWWDTYSVLASKPRDVDLEGYLFPDTYRVFSDARVEEIVEKMLATTDQKISSELRSAIASQGRTVHEILTVASIIEKEVIDPADRKNVADIFYKRLEADIALQADSTVNYVTGKSVSRASAQDIQVDNPYNTYRYKGLPPGPISAPALSAIEAAVYPTSNPYLFFLTTPNGEVIYSRTFAEHTAAKARYY